jgi:RNA polymerase sigma factor (sigma-70 family)
MSHAYSTELSSVTEQTTPVNEMQRNLEERFNRIINEYGPAISRLALSYEAIAGVREELVQEIALAIWQGLPRFRGDCSERTFVYRIAHNRGLSHVWRRRPAHQPLEEIEDAAQPVDPRPHPEEHAAESDRREQLMSAVRALSITDRQIVVLMLEDLSHAEIAEVLGITQNNVAVRLSRAKKALKNALGVKR